MERSYTPPQFGVQDQRTVRQSQVAQSDNRVLAPLEAGDTQWMDKMLQSLGSDTAKTLTKMADVEFSNLYLEGAAKAGMIQSEDEIEGNPLTRDWKVAGYRDTMGKLALADNEAQFATDITNLREKSPEEFQQYLSKRRAKIMPALGSMSREARAAAAGQLLLQDRAAMKKWTTEHTKFIIDQKSQAVHTQYNTSVRAMHAAKVKLMSGEITQDDFTEQMRSTAGMLQGSVWMDDSFPTDLKKQLTFEMLNIALTNNSTDLYDYVAANNLPDGRGGQSTILSRLTGEQQNRLANNYREAMGRTRDARSMFVEGQIAELRAQIDNGLYDKTYQDLTKYLTPFVQSGELKGSEYGSIVKSFLDKQYKRQGSIAGAEAVRRGDVNALAGMGKSVDQGIDDLDNAMRMQGVAPEQRLQTYLNVGVKGVSQGFKKAGEMLGVSMRQLAMSPDNTVLPQHEQVFKQINRAMASLEGSGRNVARANLLSGMPEDDRMFAEQILRQVDAGASLDEAVARAKSNKALDDALPPSARAARAASRASDIQKAAKEIGPRGLWDTAQLKVWGMFGDADAQADLTLLPLSTMSQRDHLIGDSRTVQFYTSEVQKNFIAEAHDVALLRPGATTEEILSNAKANLAARTIKTEQGPLILPKGVDLQQVFGVAPGNQSRVGQAIDSMLKETTPDSRWQMTFAEGRLTAVEYSKDGKQIGAPKILQSEEIRAAIKKSHDDDSLKAAQQFGAGKIVEVDGLRVQYNGSNNAGVPADWMYDFRSNLIKYEGVIATEKKDISGNRDRAGNVIRTVGVGLASHNKHYPKVVNGKITSQGATESFNGASNDAAVAGASVARQIGLNNGAGFSLMSELAYQSGTAFLTQSGKTGDAYRNFVSTLQPPNYGNREDGTPKGHGFLGPLKGANGEIMTEFTVGVPIRGKEMDIPTLVPTLSPAEVRQVLTGGKPTPAIVAKAAAFAESRVAAGKSVFATPLESAQAAFKRTAAWYYSRDPGNPDKPTARQLHYLRLVEQSMRRG